MRKRFGVAIATLALLVSGVGATASAAPGDNEGVVEQPPTSSAPVSSSGTDSQSKAATPAAAICELPVNATNGALQTKVITSSSARLWPSTVWGNLECGSLTVTIPRGRTAGIVVRTDAEVTCTAGTNNSEWCLGRVLIGGVEAYPRAPEGDSFAWAQSSTDGGAWESNSFTRSRTVSCPSTNPSTTCLVRVQVQVRNHAPNLSFRVDDSTVEAQLTYY